ncbi:hypothetical protein MRB53_025964 [Persea americana]|uniref:Uncharacterized protein n=1 Tax=Persea americana TaxID=3435 RepID=A0ACC2LHI5_PERAE|nr:hypothetical protein MRB53_025964 [Persea americana]
MEYNLPGGGSGSRMFGHWKSSGHPNRGRGKYGVAPPARVYRRRHVAWNGTALGHRQQHDQTPTMVKFKVTRPDMKLELKLKGLNLESWDLLK